MKDQALLEAEAGLVKVDGQMADPHAAMQMRFTQCMRTFSIADPTRRRTGLGSFRGWARRSGSILIAQDGFESSVESLGRACATGFLSFGMKLLGDDV